MVWKLGLAVIASVMFIIISDTPASAQTIEFIGGGHSNSHNSGRHNRNRHGDRHYNRGGHHRGHNSGLTFRFSFPNLFAPPRYDYPRQYNTPMRHYNPPVRYSNRSCHVVETDDFDRNGNRIRVEGVMCYNEYGHKYIRPNSRRIIGYY